MNLVIFTSIIGFVLSTVVAFTSSLAVKKNNDVLNNRMDSISFHLNDGIAKIGMGHEDYEFTLRFQREAAKYVWRVLYEGDVNGEFLKRLIPSVESYKTVINPEIKEEADKKFSTNSLQLSIANDAQYFYFGFFLVSQLFNLIFAVRLAVVQKRKIN